MILELRGLPPMHPGKRAAPGALAAGRAAVGYAVTSTSPVLVLAVVELCAFSSVATAVWSAAMVLAAA